MKSLLTLFALLSSLSAHATIIEDSPERLMFDLVWQPPSIFGIPLHLGGDLNVDIGSSGSAVHILPEMSANPFMFIIEIHRWISGVPQPWWTFQVTFQGWVRDGHSNPPDPFWGTLSQPHIGAPQDHLFAVEGNDHAVRVVIGALPVPEGGDTLGMMLVALLVLACVGRAFDEH